MARHDYVVHSKITLNGNEMDTSSGGDQHVINVGQTESTTLTGIGYSVLRTVTRTVDHIEVTDEVRNKGNSIAGVKFDNHMDLPSALGTPSVKLMGFDWTQGVGATEWRDDSPGNPTSIAYWHSGPAIGLVAENDIFRHHAKAFFEKPSTIHLSDPFLAVPGVGSNTLKWSIYPVESGDYWDVINAIRRNWGCNYLIDGPIVVAHDGDIYVTDEAGNFVADEAGNLQLQDDTYYSTWIQDRSAKWLVRMFPKLVDATDVIDGDRKKYLDDGGKQGITIMDGTGVPYAFKWLSQFGCWARRVKNNHPDVKMLIGIHGQASTEPGVWPDSSRTDLQRYYDSRMLDQNKKQLFIHDVPVFLTTLTNRYGQALKQTVICLLNNPAYGLDGIYHDEFHRAASFRCYSFSDGSGGPWDGCTADGCTAKWSFTALVQMQSKLDLLETIIKKLEKLVLCNGAAGSKKVLDTCPLQFSETQSYSSLYSMHLSTPLGYGNHDNTDDNRHRAKMARKMLDKACLIVPLEWTDPKGQCYIPFMYPITPMELRAGMVLGEDRTVTNRSGFYAMPDGSDMNVKVFDDIGKLVPESKYKKKGILKNTTYKKKGILRGVWWTELRMPSDHMAILIKKP